LRATGIKSSGFGVEKRHLLLKGKFQFIDRRNQMLAGEKSNAGRFARSGKKKNRKII
jgi:hypothetical protein